MPVAISQTKQSKMLELLGKGLSIADTASKLHLTPNTVSRYKVLATDGATSLPSVEHTKKHLVQYLYDLIGRMYKGITPAKVDKASMYQLTGSMGLLIDKVRLIQGLSTENVSVYSQASGMLRGVLEGTSNVKKVEIEQGPGTGTPGVGGDMNSLSHDSPIADSPNTKDSPKSLQDSDIGEVSLDAHGKPHKLVAVHKHEHSDELDRQTAEEIEASKRSWENTSTPLKKRAKNCDTVWKGAKFKDAGVSKTGSSKTEAKKVILAELKKHKLDPVAKEEFEKMLEYL